MFIFSRCTRAPHGETRSWPELGPCRYGIGLINPATNGGKSVECVYVVIIWKLNKYVSQKGLDFFFWTGIYPHLWHSAVLWILWNVLHICSSSYHALAACCCLDFKPVVFMPCDNPSPANLKMSKNGHFGTGHSPHKSVFSMMSAMV